MNRKLLILAIIIFLVYKSYISLTTPVTEPVRTTTSNTNKVFRCCENRCYLLKSLTEQVVVREVTYKEIYYNYGEETIIFSSRWCPVVD